MIIEHQNLQGYDSISSDQGLGAGGMVTLSHDSLWFSSLGDFTTGPGHSIPITSDRVFGLSYSSSTSRPSEAETPCELV